MNPAPYITVLHVSEIRHCESWRMYAGTVVVGWIATNHVGPFQWAFHPHPGVDLSHANGEAASFSDAIEELIDQVPSLWGCADVVGIGAEQ